MLIKQIPKISRGAKFRQFHEPPIEPFFLKPNGLFINIFLNIAYQFTDMTISYQLINIL